MKRILFVALMSISVTTLECQQLFLETGKTISSFKYNNSSGTSIDNLLPVNKSFIGAGYRQNVFTKNLFVNFDGYLNTYGSTGSDRALDNFFEWEASYLAVTAAVDYEVFKPGNFTFFLKGATSAEFLIQGTQKLNYQVYKMRESEDFKAPLYSFRAGLGAQYRISGNSSVFIQYMYGRCGTFKDIQGELKIDAHNIGLGLIINISRTLPVSEVESAQVVKLKDELAASNKKVEVLQKDNATKVEKLQEEIVAREEVIAAKEVEIKTLKETISEALMPYEGKGLTVQERDGKVYVTMENDMLFQSGKWKVGPEGEKAVTALGNALASNPDVSVLIEGHTDNEPFIGSGNITNNWDLSTKRATAIVEILRKNKAINPKNLTAAGRGEFDPVADNSTAEGRAKNRRIEVILTPKLDEVMKLIRNN